MVGAPSVATRSLPSYRLTLVRVDDGVDQPWLADVEGLPGCSARGATPEEAIRRAWASVEDHAGQTEEPEPARPRHSGRLLVRMPATLHDELARAAESEGVSLNQLITGVLASAVDWRAAAGPKTTEGGTRRVDRIVLAANFAVIVLVAIVAVGLLVTAWRG